VILDLHNELAHVKSRHDEFEQKLTQTQSDLEKSYSEKSGLTEKLVQVQAQLVSAAELKTKTESELDNVKLELNKLAEELKITKSEKAEKENLLVEKERILVENAQKSEALSELQPIIQDRDENKKNVQNSDF